MYDGKQIQEIEQIQLKFLKRMLGVRRQTSSLAVYGDTGQFPIIVLQQISVLKYWCHIQSNLVITKYQGPKKNTS